LALSRVEDLNGVAFERDAEAVLDGAHDLRRPHEAGEAHRREVLELVA
jgi:hypothetical protein